MNSRDNNHHSSDRFIAANILPPPVNNNENAFAKLKQEIDYAISLDFNYAWINPITTSAGTTCHRRCLDTGMLTQLYYSLYAPSNLLDIRSDLPKDKLRILINEAKNKDFSILIDFVWKHLGGNSYLFKHLHPEWKGKTVSDVIEYAFDTKNEKIKQEIINELKSAIDYYLDPDIGYGFSGLRIDAASHLSPDIREALYGYIKNNYPKAIIFEEVLFSESKLTEINDLAQKAEQKNLFSDFVTTNLYYQKEDSFGQIAIPEKMNDKDKVRLANNNGISFTGNHDHYTAGWSIIMSMAAKQYMHKKDNEPTWSKHMDSINISPIGKDCPKMHKVHDTIRNLASWETIENVKLKRQECIRFLLPYANQIARELLDKYHPNHKILLNEFKTNLLKSIANKTIVGMSGYFVLLSELTAPFETPRIFSNKNHKPLPFLLLTVEDLKNDNEVTLNIINKICNKKITENKEKYDNVSNFLRIAPIPNFTTNQNNNKLTLEENLALWLPYIIEYLRNHPDENKYTYYTDDKTRQDEATHLNNQLELESFIKQINTIYKQLTTLKCNSYETFTFASQEDFKVFVRCADTTTDIIIINLSGNELIVDDTVIKKIAQLYQFRKFPITEICQDWKETPYASKPGIYPPEDYSKHYKNKHDKNGINFDDTYTRITGERQHHQTNIFLGYEITCSLEKYAHLVKLNCVKTEHRKNVHILEKASNEPVTHRRKSYNGQGLFDIKIDQPTSSIPLIVTKPKKLPNKIDSSAKLASSPVSIFETWENSEDVISVNSHSPVECWEDNSEDEISITPTNLWQSPYK